MTLPTEENRYPREPRLFLEPLSQARERLRGLVVRLKGSDPLAPLTVAGPSTYALLSLRHALGRQGMANVRFMAPSRLAELLGAPALAARGLRPRTPALESAAVRAVAAEALGSLETLRDHPSLHHSLRSTFRELRCATAGALTRLEATDSVRAEVIRLYRRFRECTAGYYDRETLARSAAEAVRSGADRGLADLGAIIFYLVRVLTPGERELVEELARKWGCFVVLGMTGEAETDAGVRALAQSLSPVLGTPQESSHRPAHAVSHLVIAPDAHEEVRRVIRHILKDAQEGSAFHRMGVLYTQHTPYAALLRDQLALAGVATCGPGVTPLADTAVGRTLKGLTGLAGSQYNRDAIMEWLTGCPVSPPGMSGADFRPAQWDAVSRRAGVVKGLEQWRQRLERYASRMENLAEQPATGEELSEAEADRLYQEAKDARALAAFMAALCWRARPPAEGRPWQEFAIWAKDLLTRYLDRSASLPPPEVDALERINDGLTELESLDDLEPGSSLARFTLALDEMLSVPVGHLGRFGQGVFIAPQSSALGMEFDRVYLVGLVEGAAPSRASNDPLLPDPERRAAGGPESGLSLRSGHQEEERYNYLAALASAPSRVFSFPQGDPGAQRNQYPSRWFLEEASRLHGSPVFSTTLAELGKQPWLTAIASREEGLVSAGLLAPADCHDYDLHSLWRWRTAGRSIKDHHLVASEETLVRALELEQCRADGLLTRWDGDVSTLAGQSRWLRFMERPLSPTSLQTWATCPFRYFLGHLLRLGSLERPEEIARISGLEKGALVHTILERFIRRIQEENTLPGPGEPWKEEHQALIQEIAREAFQEAEERGVTGKRLFWELEQEAIRADLNNFLEEDTRLREQYGVTPRQVELRFGSGPGSQAPVAWEAPGLGILRFRGVIDRVDLDATGQLALVLDYKTGGVGFYNGLKKDPVDRGKSLQLPIYALAVRQALGKTVDVRAAYWFTSARGGSNLLPPQPVSLSAVEKPFGDAVSVIASGILQGLFPANPGRSKENCKHCDFESLCAVRREVHWGRKQADSRLAAYVRLVKRDNLIEIDEEIDEAGQ